MLAFNLKKDSWHMWVANFGAPRIGEYSRKYGTDICTYTRAFLVGAFLLAVACIASAFFTGWVGYSLYGIVAYVFGYIQEFPFSSVIFIAIIASILVITGLMACTEKYQEHKYNKRKARREAGLPPPEPSFVSLAYRKFKDKTCFKINFTKED